MTKREEINLPQSTLNKADEGEPLFLLRAQDKIAPKVVCFWIKEALAAGLTDQAKIDEAYALARAMERWPTRKYPD